MTIELIPHKFLLPAPPVVKKVKKQKRAVIGTCVLPTHQKWFDIVEVREMSDTAFYILLNGFGNEFGVRIGKIDVIVMEAA